jgi:small subunit ribosomal protein S9
MTEEKVLNDHKVKKAKPKKEEAMDAVAAKDKHVVVVKKKSDKHSLYNKGVQYLGTGRRKSSVARVFLYPGSGKFMVNEITVNEYFDNRGLLLLQLNKALKVANIEGKYDIVAMVSGGGKTGQAGAVSHGLARAIVEMNPDLKKMLKIEGLLTRDSRVKERKKYGRKKARKGFAYRKR